MRARGNRPTHEQQLSPLELIVHGDDHPVHYPAEIASRSLRLAKANNARAAETFVSAFQEFSQIAEFEIDIERSA